MMDQRRQLDKEGSSVEAIQVRSDQVLPARTGEGKVVVGEKNRGSQMM